MQRCGLTVHNEDNPVFMRSSFDERPRLRGDAGQAGSFPQNISCHVQVIRPRCVCVRFSPLTGWFMTHRSDVAAGRDIVARWCNLAEQRLEYLTELFETGRWRRYHTELAFLENIQEAKRAVETWRSLSMREATLDNAATDTSWLGHSMVARPRGQSVPDQFRRSSPLLETAEQPTPEMTTTSQTDLVCSDDAPSAPAMQNAPEPVPDLDTIEQRYPLLRNAL